MHATMSLLTSSARRCTMAAPIPAVAAVTKATCPSSRCMVKWRGVTCYDVPLGMHLALISGRRHHVDYVRLGKHMALADG